MQMAGLAFKLGLPVVALLAIIFQTYLKVPIWLGLGIGRHVEPLSTFPYSCRRVVHPQLEACEDMWLSQATRQLFLACSDPLARPHWMPNVAHLNASARSRRDAIVVLDIDKPAGDSFELRILRTSDYTGTAGDGLLDLVGFTGLDHPESSRVELLVINNRPSVDPATGELLEQSVTGANSTIEVFETGSDPESLKHVHTYTDKLIATPNRVAALDRDSFYFTNDHGPHKLGPRHGFSPILGTGDVTFCQRKAGCKKVAGGFSFPNGLVRGKDGLIYVPSSMNGMIDIFEILPDHGLKKLNSTFAGYGLDNLSVDEKGDIYAAAFPRGLEILKAYNDPYNSYPPATALRLRKKNGEYVIEKSIEDAHGEVLPAATTVIHDAKTGRLFLSSVISPFIAVCEPTKKEG